ncbi:MAG: phasin family protein [Methanosarcinales archaeon]|nr:phasin family protein [Methanosarcinales archaeon]
MIESLRKLGLLGIGAISITEEKIKQVVNELVEKGEMNKEEGKTLVHEILTEKTKQMQELEEKISGDVQNAIGKSKIALKDDVSRLEDKITELEATIQKLVEK